MNVNKSRFSNMAKEGERVEVLNTVTQALNDIQHEFSKAESKHEWEAIQQEVDDINKEVQSLLFLYGPDLFDQHCEKVVYKVDKNCDDDTVHPLKCGRNCSVDNLPPGGTTCQLVKQENSVSDILPKPEPPSGILPSLKQENSISDILPKPELPSGILPSLKQENSVSDILPKPELPSGILPSLKQENSVSDILPKPEPPSGILPSLKQENSVSDILPKPEPPSGILPSLKQENSISDILPKPELPSGILPSLKQENSVSDILPKPELPSGILPSLKQENSVSGILPKPELPSGILPSLKQENSISGILPKPELPSGILPSLKQENSVSDILPKPEPPSGILPSLKQENSVSGILPKPELPSGILPSLKQENSISGILPKPELPSGILPSLKQENSVSDILPKPEPPSGILPSLKQENSVSGILPKPELPSGILPSLKQENSISGILPKPEPSGILPSLKQENSVSGILPKPELPSGILPSLKQENSVSDILPKPEPSGILPSLKQENSVSGILPKPEPSGILPSLKQENSISGILPKPELPSGILPSLKQENSVSDILPKPELPSGILPSLKQENSISCFLPKPELLSGILSSFKLSSQQIQKLKPTIHIALPKNNTSVPSCKQLSSSVETLGLDEHTDTTVKYNFSLNSFQTVAVTCSATLKQNDASVKSLLPKHGMATDGHDASVKSLLPKHGMATDGHDASVKSLLPKHGMATNNEHDASVSNRLSQNHGLATNDAFINETLQSQTEMAPRSSKIPLSCKTSEAGEECDENKASGSNDDESNDFHITANFSLLDESQMLSESTMDGIFKTLNADVSSKCVSIIETSVSPASAIDQNGGIKSVQESRQSEHSGDVSCVVADFSLLDESTLLSESTMEGIFSTLDSGVGVNQISVCEPSEIHENKTNTMQTLQESNTNVNSVMKSECTVKIEVDESSSSHCPLDLSKTLNPESKCHSLQLTFKYLPTESSDSLTVQDDVTTPVHESTVATKSTQHLSPVHNSATECVLDMMKGNGEKKKVVGCLLDMAMDKINVEKQKSLEIQHNFVENMTNMKQIKTSGNLYMEGNKLNTRIKTSGNLYMEGNKLNTRIKTSGNLYMEGNKLNTRIKTSGNLYMEGNKLNKRNTPKHVRRLCSLAENKINTEKQKGLHGLHKIDKNKRCVDKKKGTRDFPNITQTHTKDESHTLPHPTEEPITGKLSEKIKCKQINTSTKTILKQHLKKRSSETVKLISKKATPSKRSNEKNDHFTTPVKCRKFVDNVNPCTSVPKAKKTNKLKFSIDMLLKKICSKKLSQKSQKNYHNDEAKLFKRLRDPEESWFVSNPFKRIFRKKSASLAINENSSIQPVLACVGEQDLSSVERIGLGSDCQLLMVSELQKRNSSQVQEYGNSHSHANNFVYSNNQPAGQTECIVHANNFVFSSNHPAGQTESIVHTNNFVYSSNHPAGQTESIVHTNNFVYSSNHPAGQTESIISSPNPSVFSHTVRECPMFSHTVRECPMFSHTVRECPMFSYNLPAQYYSVPKAVNKSPVTNDYLLSQSMIASPPPPPPSQVYEPTSKGKFVHEIPVCSLSMRAPSHEEILPASTVLPIYEPLKHCRASFVSPPPAMLYLMNNVHSSTVLPTYEPLMEEDTLLETAIGSVFVTICPPPASSVSSPTCLPKPPAMFSPTCVPKPPATFSPTCVPKPPATFSQTCVPKPPAMFSQTCIPKPPAMFSPTCVPKPPAMFSPTCIPKPPAMFSPTCVPKPPAMFSPTCVPKPPAMFSPTCVPKPPAMFSPTCVPKPPAMFSPTSATLCDSHYPMFSLHRELTPHSTSATLCDSHSYPMFSNLRDPSPIEAFSPLYGVKLHSLSSIGETNPTLFSPLMDPTRTSTFSPLMDLNRSTFSPLMDPTMSSTVSPLMDPTTTSVSPIMDPAMSTTFSPLVDSSMSTFSSPFDSFQSDISNLCGSPLPPLLSPVSDPPMLTDCPSVTPPPPHLSLVKELNMPSNVSEKTLQIQFESKNNLDISVQEDISHLINNLNPGSGKQQSLQNDILSLTDFLGKPVNQSREESAPTVTINTKSVKLCSTSTPTALVSTSELSPNIKISSVMTSKKVKYSKAVPLKNYMENFVTNPKESLPMPATNFDMSLLEELSMLSGLKENVSNEHFNFSSKEKSSVKKCASCKNKRKSYSSDKRLSVKSGTSRTTKQTAQYGAERLPIKKRYMRFSYQPDLAVNQTAAEKQPTAEVLYRQKKKKCSQSRKKKKSPTIATLMNVCQHVNKFMDIPASSISVNCRTSHKPHLIELAKMCYIQVKETDLCIELKKTSNSRRPTATDMEWLWT